MTIAFGAIGAKAVTGTTTQDIDHPASVGAGELLLVWRNIWLGTATPSDETGWTPAGQLSGGTGTAVDDHTTVIRADWKVAAGGETGTVQFDQTGATGIISTMSRYTKGAGTTWDVAFAAADDAAHGIDRSVTLGTPLDLNVGDLVVVGSASDTNNTVTPLTPAFSGTATFGTITRRSSGTGTSTGNDGNIEVFDAVVTGAGTCTGFSYTTGVIQCGPVAFVRLREVSAGTAAGSGAGTLAFVGTGSGSRASSGSGSGTVALAGVGSGSRASSGEGTGTLAIVGSGAGARPSSGSGTGELAYAGAGTGTSPSVGAAAGSGAGTLAWAGVGAGARSAAGAGSGALAFVGAGAGATRHAGSGTGTLAWSGAGTGQIPAEIRDITVISVVVHPQRTVTITESPRAFAAIELPQRTVTIEEQP